MHHKQTCLVASILQKCYFPLFFGEKLDYDDTEKHSQTKTSFAIVYPMGMILSICVYNAMKSKNWKMNSYKKEIDFDK